MRFYPRSIVGILVVLISASIIAQGKAQCGPPIGPAQRRCVAEIPRNKFAPSAAQQQMSQWCWAASISMIFRYYGHPLEQATIVSSNYGLPVNLPSGNGQRISMNLNRSWVDDRRQAFTSHLTAAFDGLDGYNSMDNATLVNELDAERPMLVASGTHAMVATSITYIANPGPPIIERIGVYDPWPGNGFRDLWGCDILANFRYCNPGPYGPYNPPMPGKFIYAAAVRVN
jgi:hypothetical protein